MDPKMERRPPVFVPKPFREPSKTPTGEMRVIKRSNMWTKVVIGCVGAIATAVVTGFVEHKSADVEAASVQAGSDIEVRTDQKLRDHIEDEHQRFEALTNKIEEREERDVETRTNVAVIRAMLEMELKQHGIPRSRFPKPEDIEPATP